MCITVGKLSFDDWPMFTWSLGWTGCLPPLVPERISLARPAITSLAFMLVWVPEPVCQTTSGKWSIRSEEHTSELQSLMRISYAVFCLKKKKKKNNTHLRERSILYKTQSRTYIVWK